AEGAEVEHIRFQEESPQVFHFGFTRLRLAAGSRLAAHTLSTGGRLFRHHYAPSLDGEGIECVLNGLYLAKGDQFADHYMVVDHAKPHGESHEYFNGILADRARGVFHGRILVRPGAQKTDAKQTNKNLLLSEAARATAKPQLEIYADDVKCTHGATIGQLDPDAIFYLRARGIPLEMARRMLIHSFAGEITGRIRQDQVREELEQIVWDWLEALDSVHIGPRDGRNEPVVVQ
ncbi:MAG: Fe-S cluster assembly protein SufD, partial [Verrucomicrobia bacterium]